MGKMDIHKALYLCLIVTKIKILFFLFLDSTLDLGKKERLFLLHLDIGETD